MTGIELKELIKSTIKEEYHKGNLPILSRNHQKMISKGIISAILLVILGFIAYRTYWYTSDYKLKVSRDKLIVRQEKGWTTEEREIKVKDEKWQLCSDSGGSQICSPVFIPFETNFGSNHKFVFLGKGKAYWMKNDRTEFAPVKLLDGSWSYKSDMDEWVDFDSLIDYSDYEPLER